MRAIEISPDILIGIFLGELIDRNKRKLLMVVVLLLESIVMISRLINIDNSYLVLWHLYIVGFMIYTCGSSLAIGSACNKLGYVPLHKQGTELLFQVINLCYEKKSLIVTTNLQFGQWNHIFGDPILTEAVIDRLIHHSHLIVMIVIKNH